MNQIKDQPWPAWKRPLEFLCYAAIFFFARAQYQESQDILWVIAAWLFGMCALLTIRQAIKEAKQARP